jgi:hypothetical protein
MAHDPWVAIWPVPNLNLSSSIVRGDLGLFHMEDTRLARLPGQKDALDQLLGRFTDEFGSQIRPGVMAFREGAPEKVLTTEGMSGFRDAICISALTRSHGLFLRRGQNLESCYSDAFDFYPWHLAKNFVDGEHIRLVADTPGMLGLHRLEYLKPQGSPAFSRRDFRSSDCDQPLLAALLEAWDRRFTAGVDDANERRLFRSLDMARSAMRMPGGPDTSIHHVGRAVSLWVSAFEILAHDGWSSPKKVVGLLSRAKLHLDGLAKAHHSVSFGTQKAEVGLCGALYVRLNQARNHFSHGNDIPDDALHFVEGGHNLLHYCAPLYRIALTAYLGLEFGRPMPDTHSDLEGAANWISERMDFQGPQKAIEHALMTATEKAKRPGE